MTWRNALRAIFRLAVVGIAGGAAPAADFTSREVTQALFHAKDGQSIDISGKNLRELDLAGVDFKSAKMVKVDLFGADLTEAKLSKTDLTMAVLDRAIITRADFSDTQLDGATILRPTIFSGLERNQAEAPRFIGAHMKKAELSGWLDGSDFSRADLTGAVFGRQDAHYEGLLASRVRMNGCNFSGARIAGADFRGSFVIFGKFMEADANGADFSGADLTNSDFSRADVTGMNLTGAVIDGVKFSGSKGLDTVIGLSDEQKARLAVLH